MLRHMLTSHSNVVCHGEVFLDKGIGSIDGALKEDYESDHRFSIVLDECYKSDIYAFLDTYLFSYDKSVKASGFKLKTDEYFNEPLQGLRTLLEKDTSIKVIHLKRRDLLAQYISHQQVVKKGGKMSKRLDTISNYSLFGRIKNLIFGKKIKASLEEIVDYMEGVVRSENKIDELFSNHRKHIVYYEDILNREQAISDLQYFIGVKYQELVTPTKKIISDHKSLLNNYETIFSNLAKSSFANRLSSDV